MRCLVRFFLSLVSLVYLVLGLIFLVFGCVAGSVTFHPWTGEELPIFVLVILILGVFVLVVGILGLLTSCSRSYSMSYFFSFLIFFIIIFQIIGAILFIFFRFEFEHVLVESLKQTMNSYRAAPDRDSPFLSVSGELWDLSQSQLGCCGVEAFTDWKETPYGQSAYVPETCCFNVTSSCSSSLNWTSTTVSIHKGGCIIPLEESVQTHLIPLAAVATGLLALEILGVCFACCLARSVQVEDSELY